MVNVDRMFDYSPPEGPGQEKYQKVKAAAVEFARVLVEVTPESSDGQVECVKLLGRLLAVANAAIALGEGK